jgi:hypothetical protein
LADHGPIHEEQCMSDNHGNTPAAWAAVGVAMLGFVVGGIGLMFDPVKLAIFWVGVALGVVALLLFVVMARMGLNGPGHGH